MRVLRHSLLLVMAAVLAAGPALANDKEDAPKPKRPKPPAAVVKRAEVPVRRAVVLAAPQLAGLSRPSGGPLATSSLAASGLAGAGLRSGLPTFGDGATQCRTACTQARFTCTSQEDGSQECTPRWATCVATCNR